MHKPFFILLIAVLFPACQFIKPKSNMEDVVARVGDTYLMREDIVGIVPKGTETNDSIALITQFVNSWIREQLLLQRAEMNLDKDMKNFEQQLEEYRKSLIIYTYQQRLIEQSLDTIVSDEQIFDYYNQNPADFELRENILKADYLVFRRNLKESQKVKNWFRSEQDDARKKLNDFCLSSSSAFSLGDTNWMRFDELLKIIPLPADNQELFLSSRKYVELEDSLWQYLVHIKEYKIKESLSPLAFEKNRIRSIILNIRKIKMLEKMEEDLFQDALQKNKFEIFIQ